MQFTDIQGSLEAVSSTRSDERSEEHPPGGSAPTLFPEASGGPPKGQASQGSLGTASGDEQKKKSRREWQQGLRNSNKFKSADATRGPWGVSMHSPKTERRLARLLNAYDKCSFCSLAVLGKQHACQQAGPIYMSIAQFYVTHVVCIHTGKT